MFNVFKPSKKTLTKSIARGRRFVTNRRYRQLHQEISRLRKQPTLTQGRSTILGPPIEFSDSGALLGMYREIFGRQTYAFKSHSDTPYILDVGANIGLSVLYFKRKWPKALIVAFEPDPKLFEMLTRNLQSFDIRGVAVVGQAVSSSDTTRRFWAHGGASGRLAPDSSALPCQVVPSTRLSHYLTRRVDLLKIDIEGAEIEVIQDSFPYLDNVQRLFVEYHSLSHEPQRASTLLRLLEEAGFRYHIRNATQRSPQPFLQVSDLVDMDLQLDIHAWRETAESSDQLPSSSEADG